MNYYIDTKFIEGVQSKRFLGLKYGETKPTIDLISIGITSEDGRNYYAISKDFNLEEVWNRKDKTTHTDEPFTYWHRENILRPIYKEFIYGGNKNIHDFSYSTMKRLIEKEGKPNVVIAEEIKEFIYNPTSVRPLGTEEPINFYGYYSAYDWVVFCQLFGIMINLPKGFPFYCRDLKQTIDEKNLDFDIKKHLNYLENVITHNAIYDAIWNKKLHEFLQTV